MQRQNESSPFSHIYGAYGESTASAHARTSYAGEVAEAETGWYLLGGRPYSPVLRRFLAPDPASPFDEGGFNRQAYCSGDPINRIDPTGEAWMDWVMSAVSLVASVAATVVTAGAAATTLLPAGMAAVTAIKASASATVIVTTSTAIAMATPGIGLALTVATANAFNVAVEVGAMAAKAAGSNKALEVLGWVQFGASLGMSVASTGMVAGPKGKRASGRPGATARPNSTAASAGAGGTALHARTLPAPRADAPGVADRRASHLSMGATTVVMQPVMARSELARLAGSARKEGADDVAVYTGSGDMRRGAPRSQADDGSRRSARTDLGKETSRLGESAGLGMTVTDRTGATPGKLQRDLSWRGVHLIPLSPMLDASVAIGLGFAMTGSRHLSVRAGL